MGNVSRRMGVAALALTVGMIAGGLSARAQGSGPTYVLVHGAFQDARAWDDVVPLMRARGARVEAVNLPGRLNDGTALEAATLESYRDAVLRVINAQAGPVVLVGHSFGGLTISSVAEAAPEKVRSLVYIAAYLPAVGAADQSMAKMAEKDEWNKFNKSRQNFMLAPDYKSASVLADDQLLLFCADCPAEAQRKTLSVMQREPLAPAATPVMTTAARFGGVDKVYIHTARDNAVSFELQKRMVQATPVRSSMTLDTGHSPFLEAPAKLADAILSVK